MIPPPPAADDILDALEIAKDQLEAYATHQPHDRDLYKRVQRQLVGHPGLADRLPDILRKHRRIESTWEVFKTYGSYAERRAFLAELFDPLLNDLEQQVTAHDTRFEWPDQPLDQGGFGLVYRVKHRLTGMDFAMKVFAPAFSEGGEGHLERFFREARILFLLKHDNIVRVFDVGMLGRRPYIQMEFFESPSLRVHLMEHGRIPPDRALWLVREVAEALRHAHDDIGVIHRDLKPSNILVRRSGETSEVKVIDFGLGVFIEQDIVSRITKSGQEIVGGIYTAPEFSATPGLLDPRTDVYSLGIIWTEMLIGRTPSAGGLMKALTDADVPHEHAELIRRCLVDIEDRLPSMAVLLDEVSTLGSS